MAMAVAELPPLNRWAALSFRAVLCWAGLSCDSLICL